MYKPLEFAVQMNLSLPNAWGVIKALIDRCMALPEGKYLLMKDPVKVRGHARGVLGAVVRADPRVAISARWRPALPQASMRLYKIPLNALDKDTDADALDSANIETKLVNMEDDDDLYS